MSFCYILFNEQRLQTMLWHNNVRVNSHQRWKQTRFRVCFHLWCELTSTMNVTEWQLSWNSLGRQKSSKKLTVGIRNFPHPGYFCIESFDLILCYKMSFASAFKLLKVFNTFDVVWQCIPCFDDVNENEFCTIALLVVGILKLKIEFLVLYRWISLARTKLHRGYSGFWMYTAQKI